MKRRMRVRVFVCQPGECVCEYLASLLHFAHFASFRFILHFISFDFCERFWESDPASLQQFQKWCILHQLLRGKRFN